jgi:oxygen-independent coproporphyrinogen-3 oxidase
MLTAAKTPAITEEFDPQILRKMNQLGPRYTSYPTADRFHAEFGIGEYVNAVIERSEMGGRRPLSLYIHIPFCDTICYYCACNKVVTKNRSKLDVYLEYLKREISAQAHLFAGMNQIEQLHFGGGTPTYLSDEQMGDLMGYLRHHFRFADDASGEYSIEVDPRTVSPERIHSLRHQGFNRLSLGVQDFDGDVQKAVNRIQPKEKTLAIIDAARQAGYRSVSIDLIYGLPLQTLATMTETLAEVIAASPDRIAIYNYAHLPHLFKPQRRIAEADLPSADTKIDMLGLCINTLTAAGYVYIGMDHFAKPDDDLAVAQKQGRLHRNFQGYSTYADADLIACGVSAISNVGATYSQNDKTLEGYYEGIDRHKLPIARGIELNADDLLRRFIVQKLMCDFELSISALEMAHPIVFNDYFASEIPRLLALEEDGLLTLDPEKILVTPKGRLLIRNICMVFDRYLNSGVNVPRYSKTI